MAKAHAGRQCDRAADVAAGHRGLSRATIETCRAPEYLENAAAIELPSSRRIVLRNRTALGRLNG
jgi:hypothetical protein